MVNDRFGFAGQQGHIECADDQLCRHRLAKRPADDFPAINIGHHRQVQEPCPRRDVGHVGDPQLVNAGGNKLPAHQIRCGALAFVALGGDAPRPSATDTLDMVVAHQAGNAFATGRYASIGQFSTNARHAVGGVAGLVGLLNTYQQH